MAYDSIQDRRNQRFTPEELKTWLTGSLKELDAFKREHPAEYAERHAIAERMGIVGPSLYKTPAPNVPYQKPTKSYTTEELRLRGQFTEDYCKQLFASGDAKAATALFESDREGYENAKDSAIAYRILPARLSPRPAPAPVVAPEWTLRISDELAKESGLPLGTVVNEEQLAQLCSQKVARARQAQAAADAKTAADRASELAKLTAVQHADQVERDRKQADLDRLAELIAPKPPVETEPIPLATARVIAQEKAKAAEVPVKA
jgi:hypothetical protein